MNIASIGPKDTAESRLVGFDFSGELDAGELIVGTPVITASVAAGSDGNPSAILSGIPTVAGSMVKQRVVAGVAKTTYHLRCVVQTSLSNTITVAGNLPTLTL